MRKVGGKSNFCGNLIKNARNSANMKEEEVARKLQLEGLNVDKSFISKVESSSVILKDFELLLIAKVLNIDLNDIRDKIEFE